MADVDPEQMVAHQPGMDPILPIRHRRIAQAQGAYMNVFKRVVMGTETEYAVSLKHPGPLQSGEQSSTW